MTSSRVRWRPGLYLIGLLVAMVTLLGATACGDDDDDGAAEPSATTAATGGAVPATGEIIVYAASSLTEAFKEAGAKFQEANPGAKVKFSFAASSALATQINEGAPADVFASADTAQMKVLSDRGNADESKLFATNVPVVIVPKSGSPVTGFSYLAMPGYNLVMAAPEVPVGKYSRDILANASRMPGGISADFSDKTLANLKSNEANVRAVLTKVQLGEADAGIVYSTDAATAPNDVRALNIPTAYNVIAQYPTAALKSAKNAAGAEAWIAFITGPDGQAILARFGFGKPR